MRFEAPTFETNMSSFRASTASWSLAALTKVEVKTNGTIFAVPAHTAAVALGGCIGPKALAAFSILALPTAFGPTMRGIWLGVALLWGMLTGAGLGQWQQVKCRVVAFQRILQCKVQRSNIVSVRTRKENTSLSARITWARVTAWKAGGGSKERCRNKRST